MRVACILIGLAVMAPTLPRRATVSGPKVLVVGSNSAGAVRATYKCSGFGTGPVVDVHTLGRDNGFIRDLDVLITAPGEATFSFTLEYLGGTTNPKDVWLFVTGGTGARNEPVERVKIDVHRSR